MRDPRVPRREGSWAPLRAVRAGRGGELGLEPRPLGRQNKGILGAQSTALYSPPQFSGSRDPVMGPGPEVPESFQLTPLI